MSLQEVIRRLLLCLDDSHKKICTAVSMVVASIAYYDWPEHWPELLPFLMKLINDQTNMNGGKFWVLEFYLEMYLFYKIHCF